MVKRIVRDARTRGDVELGKLIAEHGPNEVARRLGIARQTVSAWSRGEKRPATDAQVLLLERFGIERGAWREPAGQPRRARTSHPRAAPEPVATRSGRPETIEGIEALEVQVRLVADDPRSLPADKLKALSELRQLARLRENILAARRKAEVDDEAQLVRLNPKWRALQAAYVSALEQHLAPAMRAHPDVREGVRRFCDAMSKLDLT